MLLTQILLALIMALVIINIILGRKSSENLPLEEMKFSLTALHRSLKELQTEIRGELITNRQEASQNAKDLRTETTTHLQQFSKTLTDTLTISSEAQNHLLSSFSDQLGTLTSSNEEKLNTFRLSTDQKLDLFQSALDAQNRESRKEMRDHLGAFKADLDASWKDFKERQRESFSGLIDQLVRMGTTNTESLRSMQSSMEKSLKNLQEGNELKLEEMRRTVDEKLGKTLETRLTQSFNLVSERLETVHKGLGEMQQLAVGVGDLKRVLSNVKTRGILGETQLSNILQQLLAPEQYAVNCITKKGTNNRVEFAILIPQQNQENKTLLMPLDSKFPIEDYYTLQAAYEVNDARTAEAAGRALENAIRKSARDIHEKYIHPPDTTEIGLLFLPIEGLYAEAIRRPALMETLQREYQIIVTGPTTLSAILNTISFGYKTMAMEQRSGEIKKTLSAVRTEFNNFGAVLKKAQEKINKASEDIDELVGTRTRKIQSKLKSFDELPARDASALLDTGIEEEEILPSPERKNN